MRFMFKFSFLFSIKRVYSELKEIESLFRYIFDYRDNELSEKHFFYLILSTVYLNNTGGMVKS